MKKTLVVRIVLALFVSILTSQVRAEMGDLLKQFSNPGSYRFPSAVAGAGNTVAVSNGEDGQVYLFDADTGAIRHILNNPGSSGTFGSSLDVAGNLVLVGADNTHVSGSSNTGAAFLYDSNSGQLLQTFTSPSSTYYTRLGYSVSFVGDKVLTGAWGADYEHGEAYLFDSQTGDLLHTFTRPEGSGEHFGYRVAALGDDVLIMARTDGPTVHLFDSDTGAFLQTFEAPAGTSGFSSLSVVGEKVLVGAGGADGGEGEVYLYDSQTGDLIRTIANPNPTNSSLFGGDDITGIGNVAAIGCHADSTGAKYSGVVHLFDTDDGELLHTIVNPDVDQYAYFGAYLGDMGNNLLVGGNSSYSDVYLFKIIPEPGPLEILIDIKPGSDPNSVNLGAKGVVPVAIFGTEEFDVHDVDQLSLLLEGAGPREKGKDDIHVAFEYINDDLFLDLIVQFSITGLELEDGATEAALMGSLLDGTEFMGIDAVRLVGGPTFRGDVHGIPEPASVSLLLLGGLAVLRRRRKVARLFVKARRFSRPGAHGL